MRVVIDSNPFPPAAIPDIVPPAATPRWIWHPALPAGTPQIVALRLRFTLEAPAAVRLHVSADQRYEFFLDGVRQGRGPCRGDLAHWFFETHDVELAAGPHLLAARAWWLPADGAPMAQITTSPGFLLAAEGELAGLLSTGLGAWEVLSIEAYSREPYAAAASTYQVVGWNMALEGAAFPWGWETDPETPGDWQPATALRLAACSSGTAADPVDAGRSAFGDPETADRAADRHLLPAYLPAMLEVSRQVGRVRHAATALRPADGAVSPECHDPALAAAWDRLLAGQAPALVAPGQSLRFIIYLGDYYCAYPELVTSGGADAQVTIGWAASLYLSSAPTDHAKGPRAVVDGKYWRGPHDRFILEGGLNRRYDTLWWRAGRYVELTVRTVAELLTVEALRWREDRYPLENESRFAADDPRLAEAAPIMFRALQMCAHETYMDCPYYEQLMYAGDTRLEVLTTLLTARDDRLPLVAAALFDWSRAADGLTKSRYPSAVPQVIPPFSLWWVSMVHDLWLWRGRADVARRHLLGIDAVLTAFSGYLVDDLVVAPQGWNFCDWVPEWSAGWPPDGRFGASALINLTYIYALERGADLHEALGEPLLAAHWRAVAGRVRAAVCAAFWDESRGLLADDGAVPAGAHTHYSEHVQCLALLTDLLPAERAVRMIDGLLSVPDLARTTIYFSHYLFEALGLVGRTYAADADPARRALAGRAMERLFERLDLWFGLRGQGFCTTLESPEPSRSDCHAWGAHPIYHYFATLLGIRPAAPGLAAVRIAPQPGPLVHLTGAIPHPAGGEIACDLRFAGDQIRGTVALPGAVAGTLVWGGREWPLAPGANEIGA
jgi:hypothetical protein